MSITQKHAAICGRANIDAIRTMADGIRERMDSMCVNGATEADWERLGEDRRDLSFTLMSDELSMYELGVFEMTETLRSARYYERRHDECDLLDPMRDSYRMSQFTKHAQLGAQVDVMAAAFDVRKSVINEDVTTVCDAIALLLDAYTQLNEHNKQKA